MPKPLPSPEMLRKLLRYEPETGKLFWRERSADLFADGISSAESRRSRWNTRYAGEEAFTAVNNHGYYQGTIFSAGYLSHRVIWAMANGEWPKDQIDHINGDRADNRLVNLRAVTHQENSMNQKMSCENTSGHTGVRWYKPLRKWNARIRVSGKYTHLGYFTSKDDAIAARKAAEIEHGYHPNHGR
jgi:hypothetical protein